MKNAPLHTFADNLYKVDLNSLPHRGANAGTIQIILTIVFTLFGALCLLFVTVGGFRYVASQGDPQAATKAKNTITYALVGLVVAITAVTIVTFILGRI